jgi:cytochrome c oxidase subunit 4
MVFFFLVPSIPTTLGNFLMPLMITTVSAASLTMGPWNIVTALFVAVVKALLVILFFMHVRHSSRLTWIFAGAAFQWLTPLLGLTLGEYRFGPAPPFPQSKAQLGARVST